METQNSTPFSCHNMKKIARSRSNERTPAASATVGWRNVEIRRQSRLASRPCHTSSTDHGLFSNFCDVLCRREACSWDRREAFPVVFWRLDQSRALRRWCGVLARGRESSEEASMQASERLSKSLENESKLPRRRSVIAWLSCVEVEYGTWSWVWAASTFSKAFNFSDCR